MEREDIDTTGEVHQTPSEVTKWPTSETWDRDAARAWVRDRLIADQGVQYLFIWVRLGTNAAFRSYSGDPAKARA